ncbi:NADP-dependent oxidoreductase [Nocardia heshunensis]
MRFAEFGGPEVLTLQEVDEPHPGPGQIRIAVRAAGVNPHDWRVREGQFERIRPIALPSGVGQDAAGIVDELGPGVTGIDLGDTVFGRGANTYAEHAVLTSWARLPDGMAFAEAAGYPSVVETALRVLRLVGVESGQTLLVSGASGGVGTAVVQIARDRGITVIGIAGPANQDYLRTLGATPTAYGPGWIDRVRRLGTIDAALDLTGTGVLPGLLALTGDPDKVITIADLEAPMLGIRFAGVGGSMPEALSATVDLIARGRLTIPIDRSYPLADAATAHADSKSGHTRGRRVLLV